MTARRLFVLLALVAATLALVAIPAIAEVSVDRSDMGAVRVHFVPGAKGPWQRVRTGLRQADVLNETGDLKGHGWPQAYDNPATGLPEAVWSTGGENADVVHVRHDGRCWRPPMILSDAPGADFLPTAAVDSHGNAFVAWHRQRNNRQSVQFTAIAGDGSGRIAAVELSSRPKQARMPSLRVAVGGEVHVAYEEPASGFDPTITVVIDRVDVPRTQSGFIRCSGEIPVDIARIGSFRTSRQEPNVADPRVQEAWGRPCLTWIESDALVGYSVLVNGQFSDAAYLPYNGPDDVERVRNGIGGSGN